MNILLHNLSHGDLLLGVKIENEDKCLIVRPKFSQFHSISICLLQFVSQNPDLVEIFSSIVHNRQKADDGRAETIPVGFSLIESSDLILNIDTLRFNDEAVNSGENQFFHSIL
jgi:hypothetical protein